MVELCIALTLTKWMVKRLASWYFSYSAGSTLNFSIFLGGGGNLRSKFSYNVSEICIYRRFLGCCCLPNAGSAG